MWFGITQRSIVGDDGYSLLAARGVLDYGYPRLPSGFMYSRAYVPSYLLAGSIAFAGLNDLGIMLPSLILALGSLWITARIGSEVLGRPLVGLVAAAALLVIQPQTFYATSARMYMPLQAFTMLAAYSAWRGFVKGERGFQVLTGLAMAAAMGSHQQGGALLVALPLAVLAARAMAGSARPRIPVLPVVAGTLLLCVVCYLTVVYEPPSGPPPISVHSGMDPESAGVNVHLTRWLGHATVMEGMVPLGIVMAPAVAWLLIVALRAPGLPSSLGLVFIAVVFLSGALAIVANIKAVHWRFWVMLLPFQLLLVVRGAAALFEGTRVASRRVIVACAVWAVIVFCASAVAFGPTAYWAQIRRAYGLPCRSGPCSSSVEAEHVRLRDAVSAEDAIVASNPMVTHYYLHRVDAFLRERRDGERFVAFESPVDEYFGIPLIDEPSKLEALATSNGRVWVVVDYKVRLYSSRATLERLAGSFQPFFAGETLTVYVNARR